ncbi:hypothetical protein BY996DRAFT_4598722 [Phakopsora pachyrhizi]|uniref:Uncharacterized protein n=1 Tax=Phakopsora pachyrhizi TaxID=170000 RepID=A0AAV0AQE4_PHAPC|nr:hypothetical protein BY996DRAFT_4598722 [Phakopsora pachyrhizi]CAH7670121.1 hypothetical protein PPACK8108_LOCUS4809 [Phakopsora pachyrhizi]
MAFNSSQIVRGARRVPLTSKEGGVSFYKGTGSHPALGPKSQGSHGYGKSKGRIYRLDPDRMRSFIVPDQLLDFKKTLSRSDLRPYTESTLNLPSHLDRQDWPIDDRKRSFDDDSSKRKKLSAWFNPQSIYSDRGFDGEYFRQLMNHLRDQKSSTK